MGRETIGRARTGPVVAAIVGKIKPSLSAGDDIVAVARIDSHFADGLILRELAGRQWKSGSKNIGTEQRPSRARVGRLEDAFAPH